MSKYLLNKFLYTVDRDPELVERYRADPRGTVAWWEADRANLILNCPAGERSTWLTFTDAEREALAAHDYAGAETAFRTALSWAPDHPAWSCRRSTRALACR